MAIADKIEKFLMELLRFGVDVKQETILVGRPKDKGGLGLGGYLKFLLWWKGVVAFYS